MDLQQLKAFAAAARHRNITKAAAQLHITQPALSKQLKKLEETYDVKLLHRSGAGVDLTVDGLEFIKYVEPILEHVRILERRFSGRVTAHSTRPLRVGGTYSVSCSILPALLGKFKRIHPNIDVLLRSNNPKALEQMVLKGSLDIALTSQVPSATELISERCMRVKIIAVVATGYALPQEVRTFRDLAKLPLIIHTAPGATGMTESFLKALCDQGFKPNIFMRCDSPEAIKAAVLNKLGVGILYEDVVKDSLARAVFKRVRIADLPYEAQLYVVYHKESRLPASAEAFRNMLLKECQQEPESEKNERGQNFTFFECLLFLFTVLGHGFINA